MANRGEAMRAYASAAAARAPREQEAELFREVNAVLRRASTADNRARVRALADNARLWNAVDRLLRDPDNTLPAPLRAAIVSIGLAVQREMRKPEPDFDFLVGVNENLAAGLSAGC
jgi:flagellar biosynthesis regulator FlaF